MDFELTILPEEQEIIDNILEDQENLDALFREVVLSKKFSTERFEDFKIVMKIAVHYPERIYSYWDTLVLLQKNKKIDSLYISMNLIAAIIKADHQNRFEEIIDDYFALLYDSRISYASITALCAGYIAEHNERYRDGITEYLLSLQNNELIKVKHPELLKGSAIVSFDRYFENSGNQEAILDFVRSMQNSKSPKAKKAARNFLKKRKIDFQ